MARKSETGLLQTIKFRSTIHSGVINVSPLNPRTASHDDDDT